MKSAMAPPATKPTASDSLQESPELRETTTPPPADPPTPQPLDIRLESVEKEVLYLRDAVTQILRNKIFGVSRDGGSTSSGVSTPTPAIPLQSVNPQLLAGQNKEIFPGPQPELQMRLRETRFRPQMFEQPRFQHLVFRTTAFSNNLTGSTAFSSLCFGTSGLSDMISDQLPDYTTSSTRVTSITTSTSVTVATTKG